MRTRNASLSAALAATALAVSLPAHAATVSFCGPSSGMGCETGSEQMVFGQAAKDVMVGFGNIGSQTGLPVMEFSSDGGALNVFLDISNGFATIKPAGPPVGATTFNGLDISIPGFTFTELVFDEQLTPVTGQSSDPFTITANDTLGAVIGNEADAADTDKEFSVTALAGAFTDINIQAPGGFDEIKHIEVFGLAAVPEPSTWAMLLFGFAGLGYAAFRRDGKSRLEGVTA